MQQKHTEGRPQSRSAGPLPDDLPSPSEAPATLFTRGGGEYSIVLVPVREYRNEKEYVSGHKWDVVFEGKVLLHASKNPEFEACRALVAKGITGKLVTYRDGRPCMVLNIEKAAKVTVSETKAHGPRFVPYKPFPVNASDFATSEHFKPGKRPTGTQTAPDEKAA
jgi:hypothetical protein